MKKKNSIGKFVIIAILCAIVTFFTVFSFSLSGSSKDYDFVGFARAINFGIEYKGGTVKEYSIKNNSLENTNISGAVSSNATRIKYLLDGEGYETNTYQNGDNLVVEFIDDYSPVDIEDIINKKVTFGIKASQSETAEDLLTGKDVENAYATVSGKQNVVYIIFTEAGASKFQSALSSGSVYVYINSNYIYSISNDSVSTYAMTGFVSPSLDAAKSYASQIMSSKYDVSFEELSTKTYSKTDANRNVITLIALVLGVFVLCSVVLIGMFKKLGLVGMLVMIIGLLLQILILQAIPETVFTFTTGAMFASLLAMVIGALSLYLIFDKMHKEYKLGKILQASVKFGYNKIWATILDIFVIILVPSIISYFVGGYFVKQFALAMIVGLFIYGLVSVVLTKFFTKWLTYIAYKNIDYGFKREAHVNELK